MRRQRNKVFQLGADLRQLVTEMLLDGKTYDECRDALRAAGVDEDCIPGNKAFKAHREGSEFMAIQADYRSWKRKAANKSMIARALESGGGLNAAIDQGLFQAYEELIDAFSMESLEVKEITALTTAMSNLKRTALMSESHKLKVKAARAIATAQAKISEQGNENLSPEETCAMVQKEMDRVLGLT